MHPWQLQHVGLPTQACSEALAGVLGPCTASVQALLTRAGLQPALGVDISAKRGPTAQWVAKDIVQQGIQRLFREFLHTFSLQGERVYQGRLREMCACAPCPLLGPWLG